jgi:hypothetical protein
MLIYSFTILRVKTFDNQDKWEERDEVHQKSSFEITFRDFTNVSNRLKFLLWFELYKKVDNDIDKKTKF